MAKTKSTRVKSQFPIDVRAASFVWLLVGIAFGVFLILSVIEQVQAIFGGFQAWWTWTCVVGSSFCIGVAVSCWICRGQCGFASKGYR